MQYRNIGQTSLSASVIALGTFPLGGWCWGGDSDEKQGIRVIHAALDQGINLIDTAPLYGYGKSEELVGHALKGRRDKAIIATKCGLRWGGEGFTPNVGEFHFYFDHNGLAFDEKNLTGDSATKGVCRRYLKAESVIWEAEQSLKRLQTDYIDIYFTHCPDGTTPIEETVEALMKLKKAGKIRAIAASNVTAVQLRKYLDAGELAADQEKFNLLDPTVEKNGIFETCHKNDVSFFAYTPLENGLLSGKMDPNRQFDDGDFRKGSPRFSPENIKKVNAMLAQFQPIADKYGATLLQIVIAWTFARCAKGHVLCGMRTEDAVKNNAAAGKIALTPEEVEFIAETARKTQFAQNELSFDLSQE